MRNGIQMLVVSGLFAATLVAAIVLFVPSSIPAPSVAQPETQQPMPEPQPEPAPAPQAEVKTYTNAKPAFSVMYPETIIYSDDVSDMQLSGYIPVCDPEQAVVCFPVPKDAYPGTNFESAAFAVHLRSDLKKQAACEASDSGEMPDGEATINGVLYKKFSFGDAAAGHRLEGENYRVFRDGRCIELSTRVATTVFENYEPGTVAPFSDDNRSALQALLERMLLSFRFVNGS
ncbi:MAG: hypothetical protein QY323_05450 [Patescibacteria group bacterium]|nr:MAG: hypothetical protein QY323_05450 [Patescibacteria group bacterium]